jgi:F-box/TPR repeat protein Pof3
MNLDDFPELPQSLEYISLSQCRASQRHMFSSAVEATTLPNLKTAILNGSNVPSYEFLFGLLTNLKAPLAHLDVEGCPNIWKEGLQRLMLEGHLSTLTDLNIAGLAGIDDSLTPVIIDNMPNLKVLDLSRTHITGITLKDLADSEKVKIEKFSAKNCATPLSLDAVEYALRRGIRIPSPLDRNSSLGPDLWPGLRRSH